MTGAFFWNSAKRKCRSMAAAPSSRLSNASQPNAMAAGKPMDDHREYRPPTFSLKGRMRVSSTPHSIARSEEHTSELQSLMRISYAVFCLKKKKYNNTIYYNTNNHTNTPNKNHTKHIIH